MRHIAIASLALLGLVFAQPALAAAALDWDPAYMWQPGATPTNSPPGGELKMVGTISDFGPPLDFLDASDPGVEYTFYVYGLISTGTVVTGPVATQFYTTQYTGGVIEVYCDNTPDADFAPNPPNGSVPSTFVDGTLILSGTFTSFHTHTNNFTQFQIGNAEGEITWSGGSLLSVWTNNVGDECPGLFTGGLTWRTEALIPGYLFRHDGKLDLDCAHVGDLDIHPTSCPNPINVESNGLTPVALLGSPTFDLSQVELASLLLEGVAPVKVAIGDVSQPVVDPQDDCECTTAGPDGYDDLLLKFKTQDLVAALGSVANGDVLELTLTGNLIIAGQPQPFEASDCIRINFNEPGGGGATALSLRVAAEVGASRTARIEFSVPEAASVRLSVVDVSGRTVERLIDDQREAGDYVVRWTPKGLPSGMYFIRLQSGDESRVGRFVNLR